MLANYSSHDPFLNNFGNVSLLKYYKKEGTNNIHSAKKIGWDGIPHQEYADAILGKYKMKEYYSRPIPTVFSSWAFDQFEEQYHGQIRLMEECLSYMKQIDRVYKPHALSQTQEHYHNFFFHDNYAYPINALYTFFNGTEERQTKNRQMFQGIIDESQACVVDLEEENVNFLDDDTTEETPLPGNKDFKEEKIGSDGVIVNMDEIIKISGYTFSPTIRGEEHYIQWQEDIIYDTSRFITVVGSRQGGKSHVMALRALTSSFKGYRRDTLVCAFLNETTGHIYKYLTRLIENFPEGMFVEEKKKWWITNTMTGSRIIFRSLSNEADRIRWWTLSEVIMDECYLIGDDIYESVILPTLSTTGGTVCMISTPWPKNWFYWEVVKGKNKEPGYSYYQFTLDDNPFIVPEERARLMQKKDDPVTRREYFCEFEDLANQVFRPQKTSDIGFYTRNSNNAHFIFAYDPARKWSDRAGYCCLMVAEWQVFILKSWFIPEQYKSTWEWQFKWMKEHIFNDHQYHLVMDATGVGDWVVAMLQAHRKVDMALQYISGNTESEDTSYPYGSARAMRVGKSRLINNAQNYLDESLASFYSYSNEFLFLEMDGISEKRTNMGMITFSTKSYDDITNAMMIGLYYIEYEWLLYKKQIVQTQKVHNIMDNEPYFKKQPTLIHHQKSSGRFF